MESNKNNWTPGEIATLPKQEKTLKKSLTNQYVHYIASRYICIRGESAWQVQRRAHQDSERRTFLQ